MFITFNIKFLFLSRPYDIFYIVFLLVLPPPILSRLVWQFHISVVREVLHSL